MRYRQEKTTKQIENEELSRLTEATGQGGDARPTTQLDPDALRALLGTDKLPPPSPALIEVARVGMAPPVVETPPVAEAPRLVVEPTSVVEAPRRARWLVVAVCLVLGAGAAFAVLAMR